MSKDYTVLASTGSGFDTAFTYWLKSKIDIFFNHRLGNLRMG